MDERLAVEVMGVAGSGAQRSKAEDPAGLSRGPFGRRSVEAPVVLFPVEKALRAEFGTPRGVPWGLELRSDHGPQYTGGDCEALCHYWGIEHTLAPVGRPTGNAVAERLIQTLKVELIWIRDWETIGELREAISGSWSRVVTAFPSASSLRA
jgi:hypothetical protein